MSNENKKVKVHYTGRLEDGTQFDSSEGRDPLEFIVGSGQVIPGFDEAAKNLKVGESTTVTIPPEDAYGAYSEELVQVVPLDQIPNANELPVGETIYFQSPQGQPIPAKVLKIEDGHAHFDFNHELADKTLIFDIELVEVEENEEA